MIQKRDDKPVSAHERARVQREKRLRSLEKDLIKAGSLPMIQLDMDEVRKKGVVTVLRGIKPAKSKPPTVH
jgi:hypothetical protein